MLPIVAVLHGRGSSATLADLVRASSGKQRLVLVVEEDELDPQFTIALQRAGELVVAPRTAWPRELESIRPHGVTTFDDRFVEDQDQICRLLGLPGAAVPNAWDKLAQRQMLNRASASTVRVRPVDTYTDLVEARQTIGPVGIVKPRRSSTSRGIVISSESDSNAELWSRLGDRESIHSVYEELMDGRASESGLAPFVSVDTASFNSKRVHFGFYEKLPLLDGYIETGHVAPAQLPAADRAAVVNVVEQALNALDVRDRVTHTEVRLTTSGPQVIEVNGRLGGEVEGLTSRLLGISATETALLLARRASVTIPDWTVRAQGGLHVAMLLLPLLSTDPGAARRAAKILRAAPGVDGIQVPDPHSGELRWAGAWLSADNLEVLGQHLKSAVDRVVQDSEVGPCVSVDWSTTLSALSLRESVDN